MPRHSRLLFLVALAGCSGEVAGGRADGPAVFAEACARCHGEGGKPSPSNVAQLGVKDLTATKLTLERVEQQIRQGSDNKIMPPFAGTLKEDQIAAVAAYVLTLARGD
jgi:mono/diheme cytochrome c family protein